jgi:hypothetical protein
MLLRLLQQLPKNDFQAASFNVKRPVLRIPDISLAINDGFQNRALAETEREKGKKLCSLFIGIMSLEPGCRLGQVRGSVFGHADAGEMIGRFGGKNSRRRRWKTCRALPLFFEFHDAPGNEQAVEDEPESYYEWDYSRHPYAAKDRGVARRLILSHNFEEEPQEDHHAHANEAGNDASLDFIEPFIFGRDSAAAFTLLFAEEHVRHPCLAPIELFSSGARHHPLARPV